MVNVLVIIQCRTTSSRLQAKAFLSINNIPSIILCARRAMNKGAAVRIATSDQYSDDTLVSLLSKENIDYVRGSLNNVLKRFVQASHDLNDDDYVVRLTADNVLPDGDFVQCLIEHSIDKNWDLACIDSVSSKLPYGMVAEIFRVALLREANEKAKESYEREHVTTWMKKHYLMNNVIVPSPHPLAEMRCTLDTLSDYAKLCHLFEGITDPINANWKTLITKMACDPSSEKTGVSKQLVLGTAQIGLDYGVTNTQGMLSEEESDLLLETAFLKGIQQVDTARGYGCAEKRLGKVINQYANMQVITKLDHTIEANKEPAYYEKSVKASIYQSCYALKRQVLEGVLCHRFWQYRCKPLMLALLDTKSSGLINHIGLSVNAVEEALQAADDSDITIIQLPFNILDFRWLHSDLQKCFAARQDLTVYARSVFLQGLLLSQDDWPSQFEAQQKEVRPFLEKMVKSLHRNSIADLCFNYVRGQSFIQHLVIGCLSVQQFNEIMMLEAYPPLTLEECKWVQQQAPKYSDQLLNPALW